MHSSHRHPKNRKRYCYRRRKPLLRCERCTVVYLLVRLHRIRPLASCSSILRPHSRTHSFHAHSDKRPISHSHTHSLTHSLTHSPSPLNFTCPHLPFTTFTHLSRFCNATVVVVVADALVVTLAGADDVLLLSLVVVVLVVVVVVLARARVLKAPVHLTRLPKTMQV